jgi:hypothetical protein
MQVLTWFLFILLLPFLAEVPQYILQAGIAREGMIAVTQPRRVAAISLAARVAAEQGCQLGKLVGYSVRFDEAVSSETHIKYVTDGMLFRELLLDPILSRYSVIIVDEAHERTLRTDLLIANLKTIQKRRNNTLEDKVHPNQLNPLKIVVMSATLDAEKFSKFFNKFVYIRNFALVCISWQLYQCENSLHKGSSIPCEDVPYGSQSDRLFGCRPAHLFSNPSRQTPRGCLDFPTRLVYLKLEY